MSKLAKDIILDQILERSQEAGYKGASKSRKFSAMGRKKGAGAGSPDAGSVGQVKGSKKIESLAPKAQPVFREFIKKANAAGYTIKITSARRVPSHQWNLKYKGGGITPASPCRSDHQYGYALDINASYQQGGKTKRIMSKSSDAQWKPIVDIANSVGLKWQGAKDRVHFYLKGVPGSTKAQCKDFYVSNLGSLDRSTGSKAMIDLEQDPSKNAAIKKILDLPNIEIFAENIIKDDVLDMILERKQGAGFIGKAMKKLGIGKDKNEKEKGGGYTGPLVTVKGSKKYLGKPGTGMSPEGFWDGFRSKLESHVNSAYPELGLKIDNLGVSRDLAKAADPGGNKARVAGSKHGGGFAQDVYLHTKKYGQFTSFKKDNKKLAKDQKLVDAIIDFVAQYPDLRWGGAFGSGGDALAKGTLPKGRGILEFHHFEFKGSKIPNLFSGHEEELAKVGTKPGELTNTKGLAKLYKALAESQSTLCDDVLDIIIERKQDSDLGGKSSSSQKRRSDKKSKETKEAGATGSFSGTTGGGGKTGDPEKSGKFLVYKWDVGDSPRMVYIYPGTGYGTQGFVNKKLKKIGSAPNTIVIIAPHFKSSWSGMKAAGDAALEGKTPSSKRLVGWSGGAMGIADAIGSESFDAVWYADPSPKWLLGKKHQGNTKMYYRAANWKGKLSKLGTILKTRLAPELGDKATEVASDHNEILSRSMGEALAESVGEISVDSLADMILERRQEAALGSKKKQKKIRKKTGSSAGGCAWNKGTPAKISPDWKQKTLIDVISGGGKSKKFDDVIPLDGASIGIAHWAAGGLERFLKDNPDAPQPPGGARDCRDTEGGKISSGKNASPSKPGCFLEPGTKKPNSWVSKIKKWLGANKQKQVDHWNKTKADKPAALAKTWGWNTSRHMAIAAGISNSLGTGGFQKLAKANGLHPEKTLSAYGAMSDHKKRRQDRINKFFGCVAESYYPSTSSEIIKDLYSEIIFEINESLFERNHRILNEMWKQPEKKSREWDYKNMLSHDDFMHMATIDLKNSLVSMKRRGATKEDMIEALEQILNDIKSGYLIKSDERP